MEDALGMGKQLLANQLIVCAHIQEITSQYIWMDSYHEEKEFRVSYKTLCENGKNVADFIEKNHPYETPLVILQESEVNQAYLQWMKQTLG